MKYLTFANHVQSNNQPETLFTMIDLSGSMYTNDIEPNRREAAIRANEEIVRVKKQSYPNDKIGVISFRNTAKLTLQPTHASNIGNLSNKINDSGLEDGTDFTAPLTLAYNYFLGKPTTSGKNPFTNIFSSIFMEPCFEKHLSIKNESDGTIKRIILLTDGDHLGSISPVDIANKLKNIGVTIDCIGIGGSPEDVDEELLKKIASQNPDGSIRYCFIGDKQKLLRKYRSLAHHIRAI